MPAAVSDAGVIARRILEAVANPADGLDKRGKGSEFPTQADDFHLLFRAGKDECGLLWAAVEWLATFLCPTAAMNPVAFRAIHLHDNAVLNNDDNLAESQAADRSADRLHCLLLAR
jgi:hypothetical protein